MIQRKIHPPGMKRRSLGQTDCLFGKDRDLILCLRLRSSQGELPRIAATEENTDLALSKAELAGEVRNIEDFLDIRDLLLDESD